MKSPIPLKKNWVLTQDAFDVLLARLDRNQERAGQKYEHVRHSLITFFESRGSASPEDHADDTINRVARRLVEGSEIPVDKLPRYFYGVARNVLKEYWGVPGPAFASLESMPALRHPADDPRVLLERQTDRYQVERRLDCLEHCLDGLVVRDRELIGAYYQGETGVKIHNRKVLAEKLGIPLNALRIRSLRIRERLEGCVERCLKPSAER